MGNFVVDGDDIEAVLDWELASPGAREVDLVWCFVPVFADSGLDEEPLIGRYERRAGVVIDRGVLAWHRVLAFARLGYYALAGARAFDAGRSRDLRLAALRLRLPDDLARLAAAMTAVDQA
jgi:aminoglycoside phosphotransferase (APT) family kinase protein